MNDRTLSVQLVQNVEIARLVVDPTSTDEWETVFEHSCEGGRLKIESSRAALYATTHDVNGKPNEPFNRKQILDRTKLVVSLGTTTYILHDSGQPRLPNKPQPRTVDMSWHGTVELPTPLLPNPPMASLSFATPENVAMIVAMLGAIVGVTTSIIKGIESWLSHKASRRIKIKYEDFEIEIAGALSEAEVMSRLKIFDHIREEMKKPAVKIELID